MKNDYTISKDAVDHVERQMAWLTQIMEEIKEGKHTGKGPIYYGYEGAFVEYEENSVFDRMRPTLIVFRLVIMPTAGGIQFGFHEYHRGVRGSGFYCRLDQVPLLLQHIKGRLHYYHRATPMRRLLTAKFSKPEMPAFRFYKPSNPNAIAM